MRLFVYTKLGSKQQNFSKQFLLRLALAKKKANYVNKKRSAHFEMLKLIVQFSDNLA